MFVFAKLCEAFRSFASFRRETRMMGFQRPTDKDLEEAVWQRGEEMAGVDIGV
jgi:hypothetical protein